MDKLAKTENGGLKIAKRVRNLFINVTKEYGACHRQYLKVDPFDLDAPVSYFKYFKPNEKYSKLITKPAYGYQYEFDNKEIYAMTWTRKKIDFINYLARDWG